MDDHRVNSLTSVLRHSASRRKVAALMAGAIGVTLSGARHGVASQEVNGRALLYRGGQSIGTCSGHADDVDLPIVGFVNYHLLEDGVTLKVNVHYKAALPNRTYGVALRCIPGAIGEITTNGKGIGNGTFTTTQWKYGVEVVAVDSRTIDGLEPWDYFRSGKLTNLVF